MLPIGKSVPGCLDTDTGIPLDVGATQFTCAATAPCAATTWIGLDGQPFTVGPFGAEEKNWYTHKKKKKYVRIICKNETVTVNLYNQNKKQANPSRSHKAI